MGSYGRGCFLCRRGSVHSHPALVLVCREARAGPRDRLLLHHRTRLGCVSLFTRDLVHLPPLAERRAEPFGSLKHRFRDYRCGFSFSLVGLTGRKISDAES